jgi:hypothetical protein
MQAERAQYILTRARALAHTHRQGKEGEAKDDVAVGTENVRGGVSFS